MSFKRHEVQEFIEFSLGCIDITKWRSYLDNLLKLTIDLGQSAKLDNCIESDVRSYFYKSLYSFTQALSNVSRNNYNWSIVQLYYSCFYAIRADILLSNHCIVRCNGLYMVENSIGQKFTQMKFGKIRGDHQMSIALIKGLKVNHKLKDEILDIELEEDDAYTWMMKQRERVNYQTKNFADPKADELFDHIDSYFKKRDLITLLTFYKNSSYDICFDLDHSILSIPFKKIMQIKEKIDVKYGFSISDNLPHYLYIKNTLTEIGIKKSDIKSFI